MGHTVVMPMQPIRTGVEVLLSFLDDTCYINVKQHVSALQLQQQAACCERPHLTDLLPHSSILSPPCPSIGVRLPIKLTPLLPAAKSAAMLSAWLWRVSLIDWHSEGSSESL